MEKTKEKSIVSIKVAEEIKKALRSGPLALSTLKRQIQDPDVEKTLRRLQREGKLRAGKGRWVLATLRVCPACGGKGWVP